MYCIWFNYVSNTPWNGQGTCAEYVFLETIFDLTRGPVVLLDLLACGLPVFDGKYPHRNVLSFVSLVFFLKQFFFNTRNL
jgi:hypothetical protein